MILLAYSIPGLLVLSAVMFRHRMTRSGRIINSLTVAHTAFTLLVTVFILAGVPLPVYFFSERYMFIDQLGIYEVLIASVVFLLASLYARGYIRGLLRSREIDRNNLKLFYGTFNMLLIVVVFAFFANNLALFWILLELTTILSAVLIVTLNARENILAALKYVFIASTAMLFSFIGILLVFAMTQQALGTGTLNWSELIAQAKSLPAQLFTLAFMFMFIGFAAKAGIVPFHTWLPPAHAKAPSVISALLSGVLLNLGIYGILRIYAIAHQTASVKPVSLLLVIFGVVTIGIATFSMLTRENLKKLIAFSSIEHMGLLIMGIGLGTPMVIFWVLFLTLGHALIKSLLFFSAGILGQQFGSNRYQNIKNMLVLQPLASTGIILGSVAIIGTPMFPLFFSKLFILIQLGQYSQPVLFLVLLFLLIIAAAFALFLIRMCCQTNGGGTPHRFKVPWSMKTPIIALLAMILVLGIFFPQPLNIMLGGIVASLGF